MCENSKVLKFSSSLAYFKITKPMHHKLGTSFGNMKTEEYLEGKP